MLNIQLTEKDILAAHLAHMPGYRYAPLLAAGCAVIVALSFVFPDRINPVWAVVVGAAGLWWIAARYVLIPRKAKRLYAQRKAFHRPFVVSWDDTGLTMVSSTGTVTTPWSDFLKWRDGQSVLLLYLSDTQFHILPVRAFAGAPDAENFRALVAENIVTPKK